MMRFDAFHIRYKGEPLEIYSSRFACVMANYTTGDLVETQDPADGVVTVIEKLGCHSEARVILVLVDGFFLDYLVCQSAEEAERLCPSVVERWTDRDCQSAAFRIVARRHAVAWRSSLRRIHEVRLAVRDDDRRAQQDWPASDDAGAHLRRRLQQILEADSPAYPAWDA